MSKVTTKIANALNEKKIAYELTGSDAKNWWSIIYEICEDYDNSTGFGCTEFLDDNFIKFTVVVKKGNTELFVNDLLVSETEEVINAFYTLENNLKYECPSVEVTEVYAFDEDDENDNEIIIIVTV